MAKRIGGSAKFSGRHASIEIIADTIEAGTDPAEFCRVVAEATAKALTSDIRTFGEDAAASTIERRKAKGITSTKRWLATGKLAGDIRAEKDGNTYVVTAPGDRLPDYGARGRFRRDMATLRNDPTKNPIVARAFKEGARTSVKMKKGR